MCIRVIVGKYHCRHPCSPSHGIPDEFIRQCQDSKDFIGCTIVRNEEDVPWLCPNCHWAYVKRHLAPLWQQITITKCRVLQDVQIYPAEPSYVNAQHEEDRLDATFKTQQDAINNSAVSYHKLRDSTLRCFLAENFDVCLGRAPHAHRPWSLLYQQEPFVRARADGDVESGSSSSAHDHIDRQSPPQPAMETDQGVVQPNPPSVQLEQGVTDQDLPVVEPNPDINHSDQSTLEVDQGVTHTDTELETPLPDSPTALSLGSAISDEEEISDEDMSYGEDGALRCLSCANRGSSYGVNVNQRFCIHCRHRRAELETLRSPTGGDNPRSLFGPGSQPTLHTPDLSTLPTGPPTTIPPSHRGTLFPFSARQQQNENAFDASRVLNLTVGNLHASDVDIEGDERGDGIELGRFFANADSTQPEDAQYGQHVSDNDPEEPPRQRRRLNHPNPTEEEEATNGTGELSS